MAAPLRLGYGGWHGHSRTAHPPCPLWPRGITVPRGLQDPKQLGIYFTLAYVGMEMVAPLVAGYS
jgi:hypothetical protein